MVVFAGEDRVSSRGKLPEKARINRPTRGGRAGVDSVIDNKVKFPVQLCEPGLHWAKMSPLVWHTITAASRQRLWNKGPWGAE